MRGAWLVVAALGACTGGESPSEEVTVAALRTPCQGEGTFMCLGLTHADGSPGNVMFGIEGYTHRWGFESQIRFRTETIEDPPQDGPSANLILEELISEERVVSSSFELAFFDTPPGVAWFFATSSSLVLDMARTTVQCEQAVCDDILARSAATTAFTVTMELTDDDQTLRATGVQ
jgi:hypothetical protein